MVLTLSEETRCWRQSSVLHLSLLYSFIHSAYTSPSMLFWKDKTIDSAEGMQQGGPLGPLLFCLTIHQLFSHLKSELHIFYLDDGTFGGKVEDVVQTLDLIVHKGVVY